MGPLIYYISSPYLQVSLTFHDQPWFRNIKWTVTEIKQSISFKPPAVPVVGCNLMLSRSDPHLESGLSLCLAYPARESLSGHCGYPIDSHGYCSACVQATLILLSNGPKGKHGLLALLTLSDLYFYCT